MYGKMETFLLNCGDIIAIARAKILIIKIVKTKLITICVEL